MIRPVRSKYSCIEALESRIAPALLVHGANLLGGAGNPSTGETSIGENSVTLVSVLSGQAIVWYDAHSGNETGAIVGISVGPNANLDITGDIAGDIVANLKGNGRLTDSDNDASNGEDGGLLLPNKILGISTHPLSSQKGGVNSIITGGSISGLSILGEIEGVYAGDGVFRAESREVELNGTVRSSLGGVDINPVVPGFQTTFTFQTNDGIPNQFAAGASIKDASFSNGRQLQVIAGSGNPSGREINGPALAGGSISHIQIDSAFVPSTAPEGTPSYAFYAGAGGDGGRGGAGGSINDVIEKTSFGPVLFAAGEGGTGTRGAGGIGGSVLNVDVQSDSSRYTVLAGNGGSGAPGGAGGALQNLNFSNRTPVAGILLSADFNNDGADDVLVADAGTGQMVLSLKNLNGDGFTQAVQYTEDNEAVNLIAAAGSTPIDAVVVDFNSDGKLDVIVAYQNSSSLGIYLNQGGGSFYKAGDEGFELQNINVSLGFAPAKLAVDGISATQVAIAENTDGKGFLHLAEVQSSTTSELGYSLVTAPGTNNFKQPIADIAFSSATSAGQVLFVGLQSGAISELVPGSSSSKTPFELLATAISPIEGGITDFDIGNGGSQLAVLSRVGKSLSVFEVSSTGLDLISELDISAFGGKPTVAHFVQQNDGDDNSSNDKPDQLAVLTSLASGSRIDLFGPGVDDNDPETIEGFQPIATLSSTEALKNFVPAYTTTPIGKNFAALAGSLSEFFYSTELRDVDSYGLPFATKKIVAEAGDGGFGLDSSGPNGKGGAGGNVIGINADAQEIVLSAGQGGSSDTRAGGRGGSLTNPESFITASGSSVVPVLLADVGVQIAAGNGGTPTLAGLSAVGGAGGSVSGLTIILAEGDFLLQAGNGGNGRGGNAGAGGSIDKVTTTARDGSLFVQGGLGGNGLGTTGAGGAGGSITKLTHTLSLELEVESLEKPYSVVLTAGPGARPPMPQVAPAAASAASR